MTGEFFAQRGDLFGGDRAGVVAPVTAFIGQDVGDFLVGQCFVPWLHDGAPVLLAFDFHGALQAFEHNHRRPMRTAGSKFRSRERWILPANTLTIRLMTGLTIGSEDFFAAVPWR